LSKGGSGVPSRTVLEDHIGRAGDPLREALAGEMIDALLMLPHRAGGNSAAQLYAAIYELDDQQLEDALGAAPTRTHVVLSNLQDSKTRNLDVDPPARRRLHRKGDDVVDRILPFGQIGHNKTVVYGVGAEDAFRPEAVLFGSTNWTLHGLCAQTNNSVIAESPALAAAYFQYWQRLVKDTKDAGRDGKRTQSPSLRAENAKPLPHITLEDNSADVELWFAPNTPHRRASKPSAHEPRPPDIDRMYQP
jgi:hypothetical protein